MPWCDDCDRFLNPNTVQDDGHCPSCGAPIITPRNLERARKGRGSSADALAVRSGRPQEQNGDHTTGDASEVGEVVPEATPWHFKVLLVALVIYLGWRLVQGVLWVAHQV
ncbi:MAG TPA: hypothetical protein VFN21_08710 [Acidimicrobiales bacterium]|nr:hypothetical protein [Acidimicrobiales bacterium]